MIKKAICRDFPNPYYILGGTLCIAFVEYVASLLSIGYLDAYATVLDIMYWTVPVNLGLVTLGSCLIKGSRLGPIVSTAVLASTTSAGWAKWSIMHEPPRFNDIKAASDAAIVMGYGTWIWLLAAVLLAAFVAFLVRIPSKGRAAVALATAGLLSLAFLATDVWVDAKSRGRAMHHFTGTNAYFFIDAIRTHDLSNLIEGATGDPGFVPHPYVKYEGPLRNVHLLMMESAGYPVGADVSDAFDPRLQRWLDASEGFVMSPTVSGHSVEAEFELLCGLPSAVFGGDVLYWIIDRPLNCIPRRYTDRGAVTWASDPSDPELLNHVKARTNVGFAVVNDSAAYLIPDSKPGKSEVVATHIEAPQEMARLASWKADGNGSIFRLWFPTAGHYPWDYVDGVEDPYSLGGWKKAWQAQSKALVDQAEWILENDPDAIIAIMGDHTPPVISEYDPENPEEVLLSRKNPITILDRGQPIKIGGMYAHWEVSWLMFDLATDGRFCKENECPKFDRLFRPIAGDAVVADRDGGNPSMCPDGDESCEYGKLAIEMKAAVMNLVDGKGFRGSGAE